MYTDIELGCAPETNIMPIISQFLKRQTWPYTHKVYMQAWEDTQLMKEYTWGKKRIKHRWWDAKNSGWCFCEFFFFFRLDGLKMFLSREVTFQLRCEWQEWGSLTKIREKSIPGREQSVPRLWSRYIKRRETKGNARKQARSTSGRLYKGKESRFYLSVMRRPWEIVTATWENRF